MNILFIACIVVAIVGAGLFIWAEILDIKFPRCSTCRTELLNMQDGTYHCDGCYGLFDAAKIYERKARR